MSTQEVKRKLASILSGAIKDYSRHMDEDRVAPILTFNIYKEGFSNLVQHHYGRMPDAPGDHAPAEFASVVLYDLTSEIISAIL